MSTLIGYFGIGHWELLFVAAVVLLLFGHRLPSVMRSLGRGVVEFKQGLQGVEEDVDEPAARSSGDKAKSDVPTDDIPKNVAEK
jgi:sec-independent protein translocase protein TatA